MLVRAIAAVALAVPGAVTTLAHAAPALAVQPAERAYELVSPPAKLGNDVIAETSRTRVAAAEAPGLPMAATFASLGGFADVHGTGISTEYLAQRTGVPGTSGWQTHAITPPQEPLTLAGAVLSLDPLYEGDLSADLTRGIFRAWSPLTTAPNVLDVENLYLRTDLRTPGAGDYRLMTDAAVPQPPIESGGEMPFLSAAAAELRHVLFESRLNLTADAGGDNVKLYEGGPDGDLRLLAPLGASCPGARAPDDVQPCSAAGLGAAALTSARRTLSVDGSRAIVSAPVTRSGNISTRPATASRIYQLDDRGTDTTADDVMLQVSASEKSGTPDVPQVARFQTASVDGERVFFASAAQLTDTPGSGVYMWERAPAGGGGHLTLIGPGASAAVAASEDGRRVYLRANAQLVPGGPEVTRSGLFLWQDAAGPPGGTLSYVGEVALGDEDPMLPSALWNLTPSLVRVTPDGSSLLFSASDGSGLAPGRDHGACTQNPNETSNGSCSQLYLYRAEDSTPLAPALTCVSCLPGGGAATANAFVNVRDGAGASQVTWHINRALSADGRRVFFSTAQALVAGDANGKADAYEYDVPSATVRLLSSGRSSDDSWFMDASADGDDAFFLTRERLVGWDVDQAYDLYDARVGGGFPEPPPPPAPCAGEACRGLPSAPPAPPQLGSAAIVVPRAAPPRAANCRRGFARRRVRGRARCVRRAARARGRGRRASRARRARRRARR